jgi:hypothetical protein
MKFIKITVYYSRPYSQTVSFYRPLIVDLGTIYKLKGHEFHRKWAPLMPINDKHSAEKKKNITYHQAYLKCDIRMSVEDQANEVK